MYKAESDSTVIYKEIKKAIFDLKKGKSAGPDRILNEVIKYTNPVIINSYMKIFNVILKTGIYPKSWKESFTIPIYKSGDKNEPKNYKGVSLMNCLPKIVNTILNNRLIKIIEDQLSNSQFGFRENHRTADSIFFVLTSLINKYIHKNKKKIYACFVDLRKTFDSVWREALLYKLCKMGVGLHFFKLLKEQHLNTTSSLKHKDQHSVLFTIPRGVKQGTRLITPTLFNVFINDITKHFENNKSTPLKLIDSNISCLLFADDLLILSETKEGLQHRLNNLSNYCDNWQLDINVNKTNSMIFQKRN